MGLMELIRRNSDYALRALSYMARFPKGLRFTIAVIARQEDIPAAFLRKIFQRLSVNKIVRSQRGPSGGFYLLREPSRLSLGEIIESTQGCFSLSRCLYARDFCSRQRSCRVKIRLSRLQTKIEALLSKATLGEII